MSCTQRGFLEAGRVDLVKVVLPEGLTAREMARVLEQAGVTPAADFVALAYSLRKAANGRLLTMQCHSSFSTRTGKK